MSDSLILLQAAAEEHAERLQAWPAGAAVQAEDAARAVTGLPPPRRRGWSLGRILLGAGLVAVALPPALLLCRGAWWLVELSAPPAAAGRTGAAASMRAWGAHPFAPPALPRQITPAAAPTAQAAANRPDPGATAAPAAPELLPAK